MTAATVQLAFEQDMANRFSIGPRAAATIENHSGGGLIDVAAHEEHELGSCSSRFEGRGRQQRFLARHEAAGHRAVRLANAHPERPSR